jgi:metal-sulfur cluster biosynthetic enzyme
MPELADIQAALDRVVDPCSIATGVPISLVDMGMVKRIDLDEGAVRIALRLTSPLCWQATNILAKVEELVGGIPGISSVACDFDTGNEWLPSMMADAARARLRRIRPLPAGAA